MKVWTKAMSSPSRTERFQPPLTMKFLRSNAGSRSRGRSRASPMFVRRRNNAAAAAAIETQAEPTSPKVTCFGQVRAAATLTSRRPRAPAAVPCSSCCGLKATPFSRRLSGKRPRPRPVTTAHRKWVWFFRPGCCRRAVVRDDSSKMEPNRAGEYRANATEDDEEQEAGDELEPKLKLAESELFNYRCSPPKNALLLTRSRSAPYRSSSLASRFWGSAAETVEANNEKNRELDCKDSTLESRTDPEEQENPECSREFEGSLNGEAKEIIPQEAKTGTLTLTRCKSEPARVWHQRRLGLAETCLPSL